MQVTLEWFVITGADSIRHGDTCPPLLQMAGHGGHRE